MKKETTYFGHVESLRAIAALIVVAFHFITFSDAEGQLFKNETLREIAGFGAQGVELFYIISGFVIYNSLSKRRFTLSNYPNYLQKRFLRIFPPFLCAVLLICLTPLIWKAPYPYAPGQIVQNATLTVDLFGNTEWLNPIFATLKVEFLFYLVIGLLAVFMMRNSWIYVSVVCLSLISVLFFPTVDLVHNIPFFLIGIACSRVYSGKEITVNYALILACCVMIGVLFPLEDLVISVAGVVFLLWVRIKSVWLEKIGQFSYSLYLVHGLSGGLFLYIAKSQKVIVLNPWVIVVLSTAVAIVSAYVFFLIIEKRAMRWSKRISY